MDDRGESPYRGITDEAPCHQCERPTTQVCTCCNRPVCTKHLQHAICGRCDEALYIYLKRHDASTSLFIGLIGAVAALTTGAITALVPLMIVGMAGLIVGPFVGVALHKRRMRNKFFARVRKTGGLPRSEAADSHPELRRLKAYVEEVNRRPKG